MFSVIYALLFAVWVTVLDGKIAHGPEEDPLPAPEPGGWLGAAAELADPGGASLTRAEEDER